MIEASAVVAHVRTTPDDSAAFHRFVTRSAAKPYRWIVGLAAGFLVMSVLTGPVWLTERMNLSLPVALAVSLLIGVCPILLIRRHVVRASFEKMYDSRGLFQRAHDVTVSPGGVSIRSDVADLKYDWRAFLKVEETPTHFFLYTDKLIAHIVPKRGFKDADHIDRFGAMLRANIKTTELSA